MLYLVRYAMQTLKIRKFYGGKMNMKKKHQPECDIELFEKKNKFEFNSFPQFGGKNGYN